MRSKTQPNEGRNRRAVTRVTPPEHPVGLRAPYRPGKLGAGPPPGGLANHPKETAMSATNTAPKPADQPEAKAEAKRPTVINVGDAKNPSCLCGCRAARTDSRFVPGHDQRTLGTLLEAHRNDVNIRVVTTQEPGGTLVTPKAYAEAAFSAAGLAKYVRQAATTPKPKAARKAAAAKDRAFNPAALTATTKLQESKAQDSDSKTAA